MKLSYCKITLKYFDYEIKLMCYSECEKTLMFIPCIVHIQMSSSACKAAISR